MTSANTAPSTLISCTMQNRLGAFDRVMNIMTHRGILPTSIVASVDSETGYQQATFTITMQDKTQLDQLARAIQKQIYVISVSITMDNDASLDIPMYARPPRKIRPHEHDPFQTEAFLMRA